MKIFQTDRERFMFFAGLTLSMFVMIGMVIGSGGRIGGP
jgi:hypothetical protein